MSASATRYMGSESSKSGKRQPRGKRCAIGGCKRAVQARNLCSGHYARVRKAESKGAKPDLRDPIDAGRERTNSVNTRVSDKTSKQIEALAQHYNSTSYKVAACMLAQCAEQWCRKEGLQVDESREDQAA